MTKHRGLLGLFMVLLLAGKPVMGHTPTEGDIRIETYGNHAFFVMRMPESIKLNQGDKIELVFGINHKLTLYNVSNSALGSSSNNQLTALVAPEELRCFDRKKLRKINLYTRNKYVVLHVNIAPGNLILKQH